MRKQTNTEKRKLKKGILPDYADDEAKDKAKAFADKVPKKGEPLKYITFPLRYCIFPTFEWNYTRYCDQH